VSEFAAHKAFEEATERSQSEHHGARWVPIAAAILAVVTAVFSLLVAQRSTESLVAKNDAILATARASDAYNEYEARSIKQHIYDALVTAGAARDPSALRTVAAHEKAAGLPVLANARRFEKDAVTAGERSAHLLLQVMTMEVGVTFLDIAIVLVSISALVTTRVLTTVAAIGAGGGLLVCVGGLLR
jgi:hypothetical protein